MRKNLLIIFVFFSYAAFAQNSPLERKASFHFSNEPLEKVLADLKDIYAVEFSYSDDVLPLDAVISLSAKNETLHWVLEYLESSFSITYKLLGNRLILTKKQAPLFQVVRGSVKHYDTHGPIAAANVQILGVEPALGGVTDQEGNFKIPKVPVGRWNIRISCVGYNPVVIKEVVLSTGKELVVEVMLNESLTQIGEAVVLAKRAENQPKNAATALSTYFFSVEESKRYAGSLGDPARMAANFAGVTGTNEQSNALVIRGNSPRGLQWRIEGIEVPNPNHFATEGASHGIVSVLSPNVMGYSGFYTGAFSAEYGNALSGVFDIGLRNGNNEKKEYSFQMGILGVETAAEGPIAKSKGSSYLVNYRYSTLSLLDKAGLRLNRADEYKNYQDLAFKLNFPTSAAGSFSFFGIGGLSRSVLDGNRQQDHNYSDLGILGLAHQKAIKGKILLTTRLSLSGTNIVKHDELIDLETGFQELQEGYAKTYARASLTASRRLSEKYLVEGGAIYSRLRYNFFLRNRDSDNAAYQEIINFNEEGSAGISQGFLRARQSFSPVLKADYGFHVLHFGLTKDLSFEPRLGLQWKMAPTQSLSFRYGKHSKVENLQYYLARDHQKGGAEIQINKNLGFTRAHHFVLGYEQFLQPQLYLKVESYYQQLLNVPIGQNPELLYSALNEDTGFITDTLHNAGEGRNYGIELSLEKSFASYFYYHLNASLYQSKFSTADGRERNSAFNGNFNFNFLAGYEMPIKTRKKQHIVGWNLGTTYAGGTPYTPIDLAASGELGRQVLDMERAFEINMPNYFRTDLQLVYKKYLPDYSFEWRLDIRNVTNYRNPSGYNYHTDQKAVLMKKQIGLLPILSWRIDF